MAKKVCGVYSVTNTKNSKKYYGSSLNIWGRQRQHWHALRAGTHKNKHLQAAWKKYGERAFVFALVEEVPAENLEAVEQSYLDRNADGYNISKCAECAARGRKWSEESRSRMSEARKGKRLSEETKRKLSEAGKGRKMTAEQRQAVSQRMTGTSLSEATKEKLSRAGKAAWHDSDHRERMLQSQADGNSTESARKNRSAAMTKRWADQEQRSNMSKERKSRWSDPVYRQKMLAVRKVQGQRLRERNLTKKEHEDARA